MAIVCYPHQNAIMGTKTTTHDFSHQIDTSSLHALHLKDTTFWPRKWCLPIDSSTFFPHDLSNQPSLWIMIIKTLIHLHQFSILATMSSISRDSNDDPSQFVNPKRQKTEHTTIQKKSNWSNLPKELLDIIRIKLTVLDIVTSASLVCSQWWQYFK